MCALYNRSLHLLHYDGNLKLASNFMQFLFILAQTAEQRVIFFIVTEIFIFSRIPFILHYFRFSVNRGWLLQGWHKNIFIPSPFFHLALLACGAHALESFKTFYGLLTSYASFSIRHEHPIFVFLSFFPRKWSRK